jgi:hypothetical protein
LTGKTNLPLCFLDAQGGSLARLGAAVAHALGLADAIAMVCGEEKPLSDDVATVLDEVSMTAPAAMTFDDALTSKYSCVWLDSGPAPVPNARVWAFALRSPGEPQFDRLVTARLVRDRIAQQIRQTSRG